MNKRKKYNLKRQLQRRGFDMSRETQQGVVAKCSQCKASVVSDQGTGFGMLAHDRGCPNDTR